MPPRHLTVNVNSAELTKLQSSTSNLNMFNPFSQNMIIDTTKHNGQMSQEEVQLNSSETNKEVKQSRNVEDLSHMIDSDSENDEESVEIERD